MIPKKDFRKLILNFKVGQSTAEQDSILEAARIETPVFMELLLDRVDLILGTKGSGKTALFYTYNQYLKNYLYEKKKVIVVSGVEPQGDPVFEAYRKTFEELNEAQFQNFWRIYLISLINRFVLEEKAYGFIKKKFPKEVREFKQICRKARVPLFETKKSLRDTMDAIIHYCKGLRLRPAVTDLAGYTYAFEVSSSTGEIEYYQQSGKTATPVFLNDVHDRLVELMKKAGVKIWVMIDRLDEIFPRKSGVEKRALRALLQTIRSFHDSKVRIKIFLRDDIFHDLTDKGFAGLTHITDRMAPPMRWTEEDILKLIVKRVFLSKMIADYFNVDLERLDRDPKYREKCFYKVFPTQVESGPNQSWTIKWIYKRCSDGNGIVTPRDVIDLLRFARNKQEEIFNNSQKDQKHLISAEAFKKGFELLSERKRDTYLYAEFPNMRKYFEMLRGKKSEYSEAALERLFQDNALEVINYLTAVGFFQHAENAKTFTIPFLFRAGLKIKQGKAI